MRIALILMVVTSCKSAAAEDPRKNLQLTIDRLEQTNRDLVRHMKESEKARKQALEAALPRVKDPLTADLCEGIAMADAAIEHPAAEPWAKQTLKALASRCEAAQLETICTKKAPGKLQCIRTTPPDEMRLPPATPQP